MEIIRSPAVAGLFYPEHPGILSGMIEQDLARATPPAVKAPPKVLIVPHAGYIYSGSVAANAFVLLKPYRNSIRRVVIIGPSHRVGFNGIALCHADYFKTPLGLLPVDKRALAEIADIPDVQVFDDAHVAEHSLEVQLPFLQEVLDDFSIVPIVAGTAHPETIAEIIETLWGGPETLFVISSDLSHYHNYQTAQKLDQATSHAIMSLDIKLIDSEHACGCVGIRGLLAFARRHPLQGTILDLKNSGDTAGSKDSVVGYGAYLFTEPT